MTELEGPDTTAAADERAVTGTRLVRNTLFNASGIVSGMVVTLLLTPFMLHRLGGESFGIWALALTLTASAGYLSLTDLGLQQAAVRFMTDARREGDSEALASLFSATLVVFVAVAVPVAALMVGVAPALARLFLHGALGHNAALQHAAVVTFAIVGGQIVFDLPSFAYRAVLESAQRFASIRLLELGRALTFAGVTVAVLLLGRGVVAVAVASICASAAALAGYGIVVVRSDSSAHFRPSAIRRSQMRSLFRFSGKLFYLRIVSVGYRQMDKVIIGIVLSITAVATYEVANRIQAALLLITGLGGSALLPAAVLSQLDKSRVRDLFLRATSYSVALFLPLTIAVFVYAKMLVVAWVGPGQVGATDAVRLFAVWVALGTFDSVAPTMLVAAGRLKPIIVFSTIWLAGNLALSIVLVHVWGITGVVAGTVISYVPLLVAYTVTCMRVFEITTGEWFSKVLRPNVLGPVVQVVLSIATLGLLERLPPKLGVLVGTSCGVTLSVAIFVIFGIRSGERRYLQEVLLRAIGRGTP